MCQNFTGKTAKTQAPQLTFTQNEVAGQGKSWNFLKQPASNQQGETS